MAANKPAASGGQGGGASSSDDTKANKDDGKKSPREWAAAKKTDAAKYAAAAQLHGWNEHEHHYQEKPIRLSEEDFAAAIDAGGKFPCVPPHKAALSECVAKRFEGFKPAKTSKPAETKVAVKRGGPRAGETKAAEAGKGTDQ